MHVYVEPVLRSGKQHFKGMPNTKLTKIANFVNDCRVCYERLDDIDKNLTDPKNIFMDSKTNRNIFNFKNILLKRVEDKI